MVVFVERRIAPDVRPTQPVAIFDKELHVDAHQPGVEGEVHLMIARRHSQHFDQVPEILGSEGSFGDLCVPSLDLKNIVGRR